MSAVEIGTELDDSTIDEQRPTQQHEKKPRKRLKKLCSQIRDQMEFYFSDANLHKDGFVKKLIDKREDRYVPVSAFSNFNKLCELTTDMKLVVKALSTSSKLEVDQEQQLIRRKIPYAPLKDVDDRTIYVECLPKDVDQDWLRQTFTQYGKVVYISLPRYRTSGDLKGFAFIEFENKDAMEKACYTYQPLDQENKMSHFPKYNKQLQSLHKQLATSEGDISSIDSEQTSRCWNSTDAGRYDSDKNILALMHQKRTFESQESEAIHKGATPSMLKASEDPETVKSPGKKRVMKQEPNTCEVIDKKRSRPSAEEGQNEVSKSTELIDKSSNKKRKHSEDVNSEDTEIKSESDDAPAKKPKTEEPRGVMVDLQKRKRLSDVSESEGSGEQREVKRVRISELVDVKENVEVAHKRRRNKRKRKKDAEKPDEEEGQPHIKVISKHAWLELRMEYLQLQKNSMKALKKSLKTIKKQQKATTRNVPSLATTEATEEVTVGQATTGALQFTPGVIIKIDSDQPCTRKELKETLSLVAQVPYVDFQDGDQRGFVRCSTPEDALRVVASRPATFCVSLLQGEEETEYWRKITLDREQKRATKTRSKKRGSKALMERAEKTLLLGASRGHIVFDD